MKYATRDDFSARRQRIIDSVRREVTRVLRDASKPGTLDVRKDDDGDLSFMYEHSSFHFLLESGAGFSGGTFKDLYEHKLASEILKCFYRQIIHVLGIQDIDVFSVDFTNVFNLTKQSPKNYTIFEAKLMPPLRTALTPLHAENAGIARVDFKIGWDYDDRWTCYFTVECPGNDDNTTVWTSLNLRSRDDILVTVDQSQIEADIDCVYEVYRGAYADLVNKLLSDADLDLERRRLVPR